MNWLRKFLQKFRGMSTWKRVLLLSVIFLLPAGMILGALLYAKWTGVRRSSR